MSESASLFFAAECSAGIIQIVQLDLHRRDGALQVFVLILFSGDLIGVGGVIVRGGLLIRRDAVIPVFDPLGRHHMAQGDCFLHAPAMGRMGMGPPHLQDKEDNSDGDADHGTGLEHGRSEKVFDSPYQSF